MANRKPQLPRPNEEAGAGAETVPPGATEKAADRLVTPRRKVPNDDVDNERTMDEPQKGEKAK
jgi:hypothetical protein